MGYIQGTPREQAILFLETIEEYISDDHPVRFIDAFVINLTCKQPGFNAPCHLRLGDHRMRQAIC